MREQIEEALNRTGSSKRSSDNERSSMVNVVEFQAVQDELTELKQSTQRQQNEAFETIAILKEENRRIKRGADQKPTGGDTKGLQR